MFINMVMLMFLASLIFNPLEIFIFILLSCLIIIKLVLLQMIQQLSKSSSYSTSFWNFIFDGDGINALDYLDVSNRSFKQLDFWFANSAGNEINFNGVNISLSLLFVKSDII